MEAVNRIGFAGAGKMGGSLIEGVLRAGLFRPDAVYVAETDPARLEELKSGLGIKSAGLETLAGECDCVMICVKPHLVREVLESMRPSLDTGKLVISVAAGLTTSQIEASLDPGTPVVRAMPNIAATVGWSATAYAGGKSAGKAHLDAAGRILGTVGTAVELPEALLDAVTGLSGSGPAWVFMFAEALIAGGVKAGIPQREARRLAVQTIKGAAAMLEKDETIHPAVLRDSVTTPGGTTIAGLHVLESKKFRDAVISAVQAATERSRELGASGGNRPCRE